VTPCAEMVGGAQRVLEMTVEYAKARTTFGRPTGSFQAIQHNIPPPAGSDAHFAREIGRAGVELDPFASPEEFLENLRASTIFGRRTPYLCSLITCGLGYVDKASELLRRARGLGPQP
jgi:hypothetical protein